MTTSEFPCTEFACLVDYNAMTEDFILREDAEGIINFCMEHKDAVIMCCLDADRIPSIPVDDNIPDNSYWYNFLFNKENDTEVDFYNHHAEFNYYPFKIVSSMSTPISYYKSLEINYDYEAYQLYAEQEMEALGLLETDEYYDPETDTSDVVYSDLAIAKAYATECVEVYDNHTHYTRVVGFDNWSDTIKSGLLSLGYSPAISIGDPAITVFLPFSGETAWRLDSKL